MAHVSTISSQAKTYTGGVGEFEVEAQSVRQLIAELERRFPGFGQHVEENMAIAIDGEIYHDGHSAQLDPGAEVVLIPKISGG